MFFRVTFLSILVLHCAVGKVDESEEQFALKYLSDYHYISLSRSGNHDTNTAIKKFQKFAGLPLTGKIDEETLDVMQKPRCGVPDDDVNGKHNRVKRYWAAGKWSKTNLKYHVTYGEDLSERKQSKVFAAAFNMWSNAATELKFSRTYSLSDADIKISFGKKAHAGPGESKCPVDFDGEGGVLAHGITPEDGRIHFDEDEDFSKRGSLLWGDSESLYYNSVHEIGHALGLGHSNVKDAVMWPWSRRGRPRLHQDDIDGIRRLYG